MWPAQVSLSSARLPIFLTALLSLYACAPIAYYPPTITPTPSEHTVAAPASLTWDAVIEYFAAQSIPVKTLERASGFVGAERQVIPRETSAEIRFAKDLADCGFVGREADVRDVLPASATFNVLVRGDSIQSTVRVTVAYTGHVAPEEQMGKVSCVSRGRYESMLLDYVRAKVERRR